MDVIKKYNEELYHYGVLGMKWGVRRNASKAFAKASKKANKLDKKAMKWEKKMEKSFSTVKMSDVQPEHLNKGKKYAYMLTR